MPCALALLPRYRSGQYSFHGWSRDHDRGRYKARDGRRGVANGPGATISGLNLPRTHPSSFRVQGLGSRV
eukprot:2371516-Rhodomonas_salina.1